jgi:hypothetical protein
MAITAMPVTVITGFLGSGKTTLLNRILTEAHGEKIAVIVNEFGEIGIDNQLIIGDTDEEIFEMNNGCICCTVRGDLIRVLTDLSARKREGSVEFDRVVIETTGLADPAPVIQTFFTVGKPHKENQRRGPRGQDGTCSSTHRRDPRCSSFRSVQEARNRPGVFGRGGSRARPVGHVRGLAGRSSFGTDEVPILVTKPPQHQRARHIQVQRRAKHYGEGPAGRGARRSHALLSSRRPSVGSRRTPRQRDGVHRPKPGRGSAANRSLGLSR